MNTQNVNVKTATKESSERWVENRMCHAINEQKSQLARQEELKNTRMMADERAEQVLGTLLHMAVSAQSEQPKKQVRILRGDIAAADLYPEMRALGRHIARCRQKGLSVRVPAMSCSDWGHFLRSLELKRALV